MFAGCSRERLDTCFLRSYGDYRLLPADKASNAAFYKHEWNEVVRALRNVGFIDEEIESVIAVVAAVLHLGEVQFEEDDNCHGVTDNRSVSPTAA